MRRNWRECIWLLCLFLLLSSFSFYGCATITQEQKQAWMETAPACNTKPDCDAKWAAAREWVQNNAGYKIQIYSNDLIETYNPTASDPKIAVSVSKNPIGTSPEGNQSHFINIKVWCANIFGCRPSINDAILNFNNHVSMIQANDSTCYKSIIDDKKPKIGFFVVTTTTNKIIIKSICIDSPAYKAGLLPNDIIHKVGNLNIMSNVDIATATKDLAFGDTISMEISRNNNRQIYQVKLPSKNEAISLKSSLERGDTSSPNLSIEEKLVQLQRLLKKGLITKEEYETKKKQLIESL